MRSVDSTGSITRFGSVPVVIDPRVSLTRTEEDGTVTQVLAWQIFGRLHVHPDRYAQMLSATAKL